MTRVDFHTHTKYSDGHSTPREMIEAAIAKGFDALALTDHSPTMRFDSSYCMRKQRLAAYVRETRGLVREYAGRITVLCGIEQEYYADDDAHGYDCVIGSLHYLKMPDGAFVPVDASAAHLARAADAYFGGDMYALTDLYYKTLADVVRKTGADIVGHFDLIAKFNESAHLFDENDPRYVTAWQKAADALLQTGVPFEINTGAISRGYRSVPYPAAPIREYLAARGATFCTASDAHSAEHVGFGFADIQPACDNAKVLERIWERRK